VFSLVLLAKSSQNAIPIQFSEDNVEASHSSGKGVMIDVAGAVQKPGVYSMPSGARVEEALTQAGGLRDDADSSWIEKHINRATKLSDGMKVYIPTEYETSHNFTIDETQLDVAQSIQTGMVSSNDSLVSINTASQSELESLPGVGPAIATKIIAHRPYINLSELVAKKAMGFALFEKIKSLIGL
jgi:competence protein ComEA